MAKAGKMRHRVAFQERSVSQDASGEPLDVWTDFATRWAELVPQSAREFFAAQTRNARVSHIFRMRMLEAKPRMRATWNGKVFDVIQVLPDYGTKNECTVIAEELVEDSP